MAQVGFSDTDDDFFTKVEELLERVKRRISDASGRSISDVEFKVSLHLVLVEYPEIKESSLRSSINETLFEDKNWKGSQKNDNGLYPNIY